MTTEYQSSVLRCNISEDGCAVCEFLNGSRDIDHLLEVIRVLDTSLADTEQHVTHISKLLLTSTEGID